MYDKFYSVSALTSTKNAHLQVVLIGTLISVDQYLNVKLKGIRVADEKAHPQLGCMKNCFIRGSAVRYVYFIFTCQLWMIYCRHIQVHPDTCVRSRHGITSRCREERKYGSVELQIHMYLFLTILCPVCQSQSRLKIVHSILYLMVISALNFFPSIK